MVFDVHVVMVDADHQMAAIARDVCYLMFKKNSYLMDGLLIVKEHQQDAAQQNQQNFIVVEWSWHIIQERMDIVDLPMESNVLHVRS